MKPSLHQIISEISEVDENLIKEHFHRLGADYFKNFTNEDIKRHLRAISNLSVNNPVELIISKSRDERIECTVLAFDYPSEFSLIAGLLAGTGFNIISGDVFTYSRAVKNNKNARHRDNIRGGPLSPLIIKRRKIIDFFSGSLLTPIYFEKWSGEFEENLKNIISLLETGSEKSIAEAKNRVNEMVVKHLANLDSKSSTVLYPVKLDINNNDGPFTRLRVVSEDTPAFLYSLSNALSLNEILIEHVRIRTIFGRIEDRIDLLDSKGRKIEENNILRGIKLSVLLTKQFTYFLSEAPDPYAALSRFETIVQDIIKQPFKEAWVSYLTDPRNLQDLARLLGASDFLWEDFIRLQYESLLHILQDDEQRFISGDSSESMHKRLNLDLEGLHTLKEKRKALNRFKDQEIFRIDLDHILNPDHGFQFLAKRLTDLAELIIKTVSKIIYDDLVERYGNPKSIGGLECHYAIMGLGKLGGAALGYASDIETLFVYSDNGQTDGIAPIDNSEFYNLLVRGFYQFIDSKREGIFQIDLRLRPYGDSGPLASSMESFCRYYDQDGQAHAYERLSLVRMRHVGGDSSLGAQLERIRDDIIYFSNVINFKEVRNLREKQFKEKKISGKINAKYSPGGLVDLEYGVQALQVIYGGKIPGLRTPRIHEALNALSDAGVLSQVDASRLVSAYNFLRDLINGLRMLRGSAKDLFLPEAGTNEFGHLARRMGYVWKGPIDSAQRLHIDFETHTAVIRVFAEKYFGRESLPSTETGTIVDVILSDSMPDELKYRILTNGGIRDTRRAYVNLKGLAGDGSRKEAFSRIALLVWDLIKRMPNPDMALNNWDRYVHSLASPEFHYNLFMSQPMQLEILLNIFSGSQFLSDTLVRHPGFTEWLMIPEILHNTRKREDIENELRKAARGCSNIGEWLNKLRRLRRREILRVGVRDICLETSTRVIMKELTTLAEACTQVVLEGCIAEEVPKGIGIKEKLDKKFCIMAFGKMGGNELNYSSDIDLLGVCSDSSGYESSHKGDNGIIERCSGIMDCVRSHLSSYTDEGYAYRVDLRLRPFGKSGELVHTVSSLIDYYHNSALLWEIQAALKLRPVAGNLRIGYELLESLKDISRKPRKRNDIIVMIEKMRNSAIRSSSHSISNTIDVKSGIGGIRDVEFMVQGLQLMHASENRMLIEGNTMLAVDSLTEAGIIPEDTAAELKDDYIFLRRIEHYLQILEDRQTHSLPKSETELIALSKRMLGSTAGADQFMDQLESCLKRVRENYDVYLLGKN
ncbi:glutamate-ammonia-ligase adenylyltransferase [Deltaproteobacteria bacterium]|nr:glutamate-ammonia-ligase adenylyltransferase [Deltaproteobacteria bacterium]